MKLRFGFVLLAFIFIHSSLSAQPTINWEKNFGTNAFGSSVAALSDGFIGLGSSGAYPHYTAYIVRTDLQGTKSWEKTYGDNNNAILPGQLAKSSDGGFVFSGQNNNYPYMMKIDGSGAKVWDAYPMGETSYGSANAVITISDGYILTGYVYQNSHNSLFIAKVTLAGSVAWSKTITDYSSSAGNAIAAATGGYIITGGADSGPGMETLLLKTDASGTKVWAKTYGGVHSSNDLDQGNSVAETSDGGFIIAGFKALSTVSGNTALDLIKTSSDGSQTWRTQPEPLAKSGHAVIPQSDGYIITGTGIFLKANLSGNLLWDKQLNAQYSTGLDAATGSNFITVGSTSSNQLYLGYITVSTPAPPRYFVIVDANNAPITGKEVTFYKGTLTPGSDPKIITQTTDANGKIKIDPTWYNDGDNIRALITVQTVATQKPLHYTPEISGTAYRILLDNVNFDERTSFPNTDAVFEKYQSSPSITDQKLTLNHSMIVFDLMISIEWDADKAFTDEMQKGMLLTSNYLFDVFDGQAALGNIAIYDDKVNWNGADVLFNATTETTPHAGIQGYLSNSIGDGKQVLMPRRWFGGTANVRQNTVNDNWLESFTESAWRTLGHELGHQLLGFYDEYKDNKGVLNDSARGYYILGYMDAQYAEADNYYRTTLDKVYSSELSSAERYRNPDKITWQWIANKSDCWSQFEKQFEGMHNGIYCPIYKPSERTTRAAGSNYFIGPNDKNYTKPKYDISSIEKQTVFNKNTSGLIQNVWTLSAGSTPGNLVQTLLKKKTSGRMMDLGLTNNEGKIRFLGAETGDTYTFTGYFGGKNTGQAVSLTNTVSIPDKGKISVSSLDTNIQLHIVDGDYRFVPVCMISSGKTEIGLKVNKAFSAAPSSQIAFDNGTSENAAYQYDQATQTYSATMDSLPLRGIVLFTASDASHQPFNFPLNYSTAEFGTSMFGDNGNLWLMLDSTNAATVLNVTVISSNFGTLRNGLESDAEQAGNVHCIVLPAGLKSLSGSNALTIRYAHGDVTKLSEYSLRIFKWDEAASMWLKIGGNVDTIHQEINAPITSGGTYAAFTISQGAGVNNQEGYNDLALSAAQEEGYSVIHFTLSKRENAEISVCNSAGISVATLASGEIDGGAHRLIWNTALIPNGIYFCTVKTKTATKTVKIAVVH